MRIAFLFNHDQVHQVAHGLPIALALAGRGAGAEILLCSTSDRITAELRALGGRALEENLKLVELRIKSGLSLVADSIAGKLVPSAKLLIYRDNLDFFKSIDVLVVPEKTSLILKDRFQLHHLKIIHTRHGAGDRAIGFSKASARFDHVLASGPKVQSRLIREAGVAPDRVTIVGYPKFDLFGFPPVQQGKADGRPVVLYNPHVAPHLSSWFKKGREILQWFVANPGYRLIFAPHIMLFERQVVVTIQPPGVGFPGSIPRIVADAPNILVDTGSRALTTMEYPNQADIYLGDASSQVYEFLALPRPCMFFDAHGSDWNGNANFGHWQAGRVISRVDQLGDALSNAFSDHREHYLSVQLNMVRDTFDLRAERSSDRAADVIMQVAGLHSARKPRKRAPSRSKATARSNSVIAARSSAGA